MAAVPGRCSWWLFINHEHSLDTSVPAAPTLERVREQGSKPARPTVPGSYGQTFLHLQAREPPVSSSSFLGLEQILQPDLDLERWREASCQAPCWALKKGGAAEWNGTGMGFAVTLGSRSCHLQTAWPWTISSFYNMEIYKTYRVGCCEDKMLWRYECT